MVWSPDRSPQMRRQPLPTPLLALALAAGLSSALAGQVARADGGGRAELRTQVRVAKHTSARGGHATEPGGHCRRRTTSSHRQPVRCIESHATKRAPVKHKTPRSARPPVPSPTPAPAPASGAPQGFSAPAITEPTAPTTPELAVTSVNPWKTQAQPVAWVGGRIYYNQRSESGLFNGWSANPDGSEAVCVTCGTAYPSGTQHGIGDASPDGQYLLTTIERANHPPVAVGTPEAAPGDGAFNDLWLQTADGSHAWQLTNEETSGTTALIWPRFDSTGTRVIWSEQWQWGVPFGGWRMHVAQLTWSDGVPSLTNEKTLQSTGLLEPYGFTPDGSHVLFAADALAGTPWDDLQIMTMPSDLSGTATRLSPEDDPDTGWFSNYNEFAFTMPGSGRIIFARSVGAYYESMEYWTMNANGSDPRQLTWLSVPWSSQYQGHPSLATTLAFDPSDPNVFVAAIETDYHGDYKSLMITLN
jgi:hypothetical protein